jgi:hypothetical protein
MANNITPKLKAYVQTDGTGRVVSGSPVFRTSKPKNGNWREIPMYYRGSNPSTTTTSTSHSGGGGNQPTAWVITGYTSRQNGCDNINPQTAIGYTQGSTLGDWTTVWADAALTIPFDASGIGGTLWFSESPDYSNCYFNTTGDGLQTWIYSCTQCF